MTEVNFSNEQARIVYNSCDDISVKQAILQKFSALKLGLSECPNEFKDLGKVGGFCISENENDEVDIVSYISIGTGLSTSLITMPEKSDCESYIAGCQLRQIAKFCNGGKVESEWIDWNDFNQEKYYIFGFISNDILEAQPKFSVESAKWIQSNQVYFKKKMDAEVSLVVNRGLWLEYFKLSKT